MSLHLLAGIGLLVVGLGSLHAYITKNEKMFWKKKRMIKFWGKKRGTFIHFTGYVIVPIISGLYILFTELLKVK